MTAPAVLLLIPASSYRTHDFLEAAHALDLEVHVGTDQPQVPATRGSFSAQLRSDMDLRRAADGVSVRFCV